jgi:hypothetical protein
LWLPVEPEVDMTEVVVVEPVDSVQEQACL